MNEASATSKGVRCRRHAAKAAAFGAVVSLVAPAAAHADVTVPADPTGGALGDTQSSVQTWVVTYGVPVVFGLMLLGILIRLAVKWAKKAGRMVG